MVGLCLIRIFADRDGAHPGHPGLYGADDLHEAINPARLAVMESDGWALSDPRSRAAFEAVLGQLQAQGVTVLRRGDLPELEALEEAIANCNCMSGPIILCEYRWQLENLHDTMPEKLSPATRGLFDRGKNVDLAAYRRALADREIARVRLAALASQCDALIALSCLGPAPKIGHAGANGMETGGPAFSTPTSVMGGPALTLPLIEIDAMPVGVQLVGQWHSDDRICGIGQWIYDAVTPVKG